MLWNGPLFVFPIIFPPVLSLNYRKASYQLLHPTLTLPLIPRKFKLIDTSFLISKFREFNCISTYFCIISLRFKEQVTLPCSVSVLPILSHISSFQFLIPGYLVVFPVFLTSSSLTVMTKPITSLFRCYQIMRFPEWKSKSCSFFFLKKKTQDRFVSLKDLYHN